MVPAFDPAAAPGLIRLIRANRRKIGSQCPDQTDRWLLVDTSSQRLVLIRADAVEKTWPVSTARAGLDNREGSGGTPPGLHVIEAKIGADSTPGTEFESRVPTGRILPRTEFAGLADDGPDLILTRILTLRGLDNGLNRGPGVDSLERYIYIHGTNREDALGRPESQGCVRMGNADVADLFDRVEEGDPVVIV